MLEQSEPSEIPQSVRARLTLLTAPQVCELLQVNLDWLYDVCRKGTFPHVRVGRHIRFRPTDLEAYLDGAWECRPEESLRSPRGRRKT